MKQFVAGIIAHVDAGKTTLSEAMLYQTGTVRKLGRVDHGEAFLDSDSLEKQRGITIFSHQANLQYQDLALTLLDTPGHVDFAAQTEQVLSVLDYAILVVSATDGIQGYTRTLWHLLERYQVPVFIFINKTDITDQQAVLTQLQAEFSSGCLDFDQLENSYEELALQDDAVLERYLENGTIAPTTIQKMIQKRQVFPVYSGSALKLLGVDNLLQGLAQWTLPRSAETDFGARVFKISHDQGERLTWLPKSGGSLRTKEILFGDQKINQLRIYNGAKFTTTTELTTGAVCAIPGLTGTYAGQGLGFETDSRALSIQPVLTYSVAPKGQDLHACLQALRELEDEDGQLHVTWSRQLQEIRVQIMGSVQLEILQQLLSSRFGLEVGFDEGQILYKETVTQAIEGVGHFEPLRHYSEVHLLLQPAPEFSFDSECSLEVLGRNWQHQVLTSLGAKEHLGVLIGAPLANLRISLINGRASNVHSVGGDFREATWRAVRQGLMMAKTRGLCQLLEPWYRFRLVVETAQVGRAMTDIQRMHGDFEAPVDQGTTAVITGTAPVATMQNYAQEVQAYTHGQGQLECLIDGYRPCHNQDEVIAAHDYDPVADLENTPDSVFCAHGAGFPVAWDRVPGMAHCEYLNL